MVISTIGKTTRPDNLPEETQDKVRCALYQVVGVNVDKVAPEHLIMISRQLTEMLSIGWMPMRINAKTGIVNLKMMNL